MIYAIRTHKLNKSFNGKEVVSNLDLNVKKGEIHVLLGQNGASKTTIVKMLTNLLKPTSGEIEIFGDVLDKDSYKFLRRIGVIIESPVFYDHLSGEKNLEIHCAYSGYHTKDSVLKAINLLGLSEVAQKPIKSYSVMMKQRLGIARIILAKPELLILDEPFNTLDATGVEDINNLFRTLCKERGVTILITQNSAIGIEQIADTVSIIANGKLIEEVSVKNFQQEHITYYELETDNPVATATFLEYNLNITNFKLIKNRFFRIYETNTVLKELTKQLILQGIGIESIVSKKNSLENYFLTSIESS